MKDKTRQEKQSIEPLFSFKQKKEDSDKIINTKRIYLCGFIIQKIMIQKKKLPH